MWTVECVADSGECVAAYGYEESTDEEALDLVLDDTQG
jgi:hypothetical protein